MYVFRPHEDAESLRLGLERGAVAVDVLYSGIVGCHVDRRFEERHH
jgi:hypothetical protein